MRTVSGHTVTVEVDAGAPAGVGVGLPPRLDADLRLRFAAPGVALESARFGLGETAVALSVAPVPAGGLEVCLPVAAALRAEAGGRALRLLRHGAEGWAPVAGARDAAAPAARVCASGLTAFGPFAVGYPDRKPSFGAARVPAQRLVQGVALAPLALPAATGGDGPLAYTLTGPSATLPEGLTYTPPADAATGGTLAGTPEGAAPAAPWTLTATDADGDSATLAFPLEVAADTRPSFAAARLPAQRLVQGVAMTPLALPAAAGGNPPLAYTLSPALPQGVTYTPPADAATGGTMAGTPGAVQGPVRYTLTATDADGDSATLAFSLEVVDRREARLWGIHEAILPDLSRAMAAGTVEAVAGRIARALSAHGAGPPSEAPGASLARLLRAHADGAGAWTQALDGRRFALAADVTVWGAGEVRSLSGGAGRGVAWNGSLLGAHLGVDARLGAGGLAGLALSVSEGRLDYTDRSPAALGAAVEGDYESRMTSAHPYLGWAWGEGRHAWAALGAGRGTVEVADAEAGRGKSASTLRSAAAGGRVRVLSAAGGTLDLAGEAWTARLGVAGDGARFAGHTVRTHRLRVAAQGARAFALGAGASVTPSVAWGLRLDGGDGQSGAGMELGGGVDYAHPALGLSADVAGRGLVAHQGNTQEWSVGGALRLAPASGRGWSLRLAPSYGETGSGLARRWEHGPAPGPSPTAQVDTEVGYGLAAFAGTLTPYGGFALSGGGARGFRLGARFRLGPAVEMALEGERRAGRSPSPDHALVLRGRMRW